MEGTILVAVACVRSASSAWLSLRIVGRVVVVAAVAVVVVVAPGARSGGTPSSLVTLVKGVRALPHRGSRWRAVRVWWCLVSCCAGDACAGKVWSPFEGGVAGGVVGGRFRASSWDVFVSLVRFRVAEGVSRRGRGASWRVASSASPVALALSRCSCCVDPATSPPRRRRACARSLVRCRRVRVRAPKCRCGRPSWSQG